jgi:hypothetical protein
LARPFCFGLERAFSLLQRDNTKAALNCKHDLGKSLLLLPNGSRAAHRQAVAVCGSVTTARPKFVRAGCLAADKGWGLEKRFSELEKGDRKGTDKNILAPELFVSTC